MSIIQNIILRTPGVLSVAFGIEGAFFLANAVYTMHITSPAALWLEFLVIQSNTWAEPWMFYFTCMGQVNAAAVTWDVFVYE
ncbi:hypothetical protein N7530_001197 [Penicillium desertorum]|uniref:Uncharacterized protein n=1 Tax=Penicillium desertorum TaxID=1303715 RepID=A0A9W9X9M2_9EURO|nr:hypothetical protein N7530_001197 [Penicillium desertorum]